MHFARGGRLFALLGGDGSGKSTCTAELRRWLAPHFHVSTAHLGRPPRSATTLLIGGIRKVYRAICRAFAGPASEDGTGVLDLLRHVCTARDRYHLFLKSRRFATAGGVALCERYPVPQNRLLVGPEIARLVGHGRDTPLARRLMRAEQAYYGRITPPDVILVLLVEPEIAVQRKTTEPPDYVRARARIMWETDWTGTGAHLVDANQQLGSVVADLKTLIWSEV
jgi:thymidylate kinase